MTGKRIMFFVLLLAFVAGGVGIGWLSVRGMSELNELGAQIEKEQGLWDDLQAERRDLEATVESEKERLAELPDSLKTMTNAQAIKSSLSFAKQETIIETKEMRVKKRLEYLESEKNRVKGAMVRGSAKIGVVELVLLVGLIIAWRRLDSSRRLST